MKKILIVPDVHGRSFWKEPVYKKDYEKVIFLGDYLDPYEPELREGDIDNFKEILKFKNDNPEKVVLLIGNHDRHYMPRCKYQFSRFSIADKMKCNDEKIFEQEEMEIIYEETINGNRFVFSHAGVSKEWYDFFIGEDEFSTDIVKKHYKEYPEDFDEISSYYRGGSYMCGSPIWADVREFSISGTIFADIKQVFGHTQLKDSPICIKDCMYCLDVRRCFYIDEEGTLREMDGTKVGGEKEKENLKKDKLAEARMDFGKMFDRLNLEGGKYCYPTSDLMESIMDDLAISCDLEKNLKKEYRKLNELLKMSRKDIDDFSFLTDLKPLIEKYIL